MSNQPRHQHEDPALQGMIRSMREFVRDGESEHLSELSKARHRADLLALASSMSTQTASTPPNTSSPSRWSFLRWEKKRAFAVAAALAVFVLVLNLSLSALPFKRSSTVTRLLVPAAQTAQAFVLEANQAYPGGIDPASGWTLKASVPTSREAVEKAIRIEPPVAVHVEKGSDENVWRVIPNEPLRDDAVYRVKLAAAIQEGNAEIPYEYSWAQQTVGSFRVEGFSPAAGRGYIPRDAAIEAMFSREGFMDPAAYFELQPAVEGRLEVRGQTVVFLPSKPLDAGRVYQVRWKAGFGIKDTPSMQLTKDVAYAFQVEDVQDTPDDNTSIYLPTELQVPVQKELVVPMNAMLAEGEKKVQVRMYPVSQEEAKRYYALRQGGWFWSWSAVRRADIAKLVEGKSPIFSNDISPVARSSPNGYTQDSIVRLPGQGAGFYLISVANAGTHTSGDWTLAQVTDIAVYAQMDETKLIQWIVDAKTAKPISGATIRLNGVETTSDADGIATATLPEGFRAEAAQGLNPEVASVSAHGQTTLVLLQTSVPWDESLGQKNLPIYTGNRSTWVSMGIDRDVQRQTDTLHISGIAADRLSKRAAPNLTLRVVTESLVPMYANGYSQQAVLDTQSLLVDEAGRFTAEVSWKDRAVGTYAVQVLRDNQIIGSQSFSIRADAKPTVRLEFSKDRLNYIAGETVRAHLAVTHVDGTPYPGAIVEAVFSSSNHTPNEMRLTVQTDGRGMAEVVFPTRAATSCRIVDGGMNGVCYGASSYTIEARLKEASEGEVMASVYGTLHASALRIIASDLTLPSEYAQGPRADIVNGVARVSGRVGHLSFTENDETTYSAVEGTRVDGTLYEVMNIQEQTGTSYDPVSKTAIPVYSYRNVSSRIAAATVIAGSDGTFSFEFATPHATSTYIITFTTKDERGRGAVEAIYAYAPYVPQTGNGSPAPSEAAPRITINDPASLVLKDVKTGKVYQNYETNTYLVKEELQNTKELQAVIRDGSANTLQSRPLYILAARGIVDTVANDDVYRFRMLDQYLPNATLTAVMYTDQGFLEMSQSFDVSPELYQLKVETKPITDQRILPGQTAKFRVRVTSQDGRPVANGQVVLSLADLALESMGAFASQVDPVRSLYNWRDSGILARASTHKMESLNAGAEGGGGGDAGVLNMPRKDFKDQAAFVVGRTDAAGMAELEVTLPDNVTTWRVETRVISDDLQAGWEVTNLEVSKPLAVSASVPRTITVGDEARLKLMPIARDLAKDAVVEYVVDAPTLGIQRQGFSTKGYEPVYIPVTATEAMRGMHQLTVGVRANNLQDAMQFTITVIDQVPTKTVWEQEDALNGFHLPETLADSGSVLLTSRARASLVPQVQGLLAWMGDSPRLESIVADRLARAMMKELGVEPDVSAAVQSFADYQRGSGLLAPLAYSSETLDSTLEVAYSGLAVGDRDALAKGLLGVMQKKDEARLQRLKAASALALSGRPVLNALQDAARQTDLTPAEEGVLLRTYAALGMRNEAKTIFDRWMVHTEQKDGGMIVKFTSAQQETADATRIALYASYVLRSEQREALQIGSDRLRDDASFLPILDAQILQERIAQAPNEDVKIVYVLGQQRYERNLNEGSVALHLQKEEWKQFSIESVTGNAVIQWQRRVVGIAESTPGMTLQRSYRLLDRAGNPKEGDLVQVTLQPRFSSRDTHGCYEVRDRTPANLVAIVSGIPFVGDGTLWGMPTSWQSMQQSDGSVSFVSCGDYQDDVTYIARVVGSGTYTAPAPVLQNLESPSLGAVGTPTSFRADAR